MWIFILFCFATVDAADGYNYFRRCLLHRGRCVTHCPPNMHPYHTRCDTDTMSQRTCDSLYVYSLGYTCGWSRCDCNDDLVLDEVSGYCMGMESCPTTSHKNRKRGARKPKRKDKAKMKKKIRYSEADIPDMS